MASPQSVSPPARRCKEPSCTEILPVTDLHPHCYLHRGCIRTRVGGDPASLACKTCKGWSRLQLEASVTRRRAWERNSARASPPVVVAISCDTSDAGSPPPLSSSSSSFTGLMSETALQSTVVAPPTSHSATAVVTSGIGMSTAEGRPLATHESAPLWARFESLLERQAESFRPDSLPSNPKWMRRFHTCLARH